MTHLQQDPQHDPSPRSRSTRRPEAPAPAAGASARCRAPGAGERAAADRALARAIERGEPGAFDRLHDAYRPRVFAYALRRLRSPAEADDVCQEVFLEASLSIGSYAGRSSLASWLRGIARHRVAERFRGRREELGRAEDVTPEAWDDGAVSPDRAVDAAALFRRFCVALERDVRPEPRRIFQLRYGEGLANAEVAERVGRSEQAVAICLMRTRDKLAWVRRELAGEPGPCRVGRPAARRAA